MYPKYYSKYRGGEEAGEFLFKEGCQLINMQEMTELENHGFASIYNFNYCSRQESSMDFEIIWRKLLGN